MNKNVYAYLLLGAVVLAGFGGFYFADQLSDTIEVQVPQIFSGTLEITVDSEGQSSVDGFSGADTDGS